MPRWSPSPIWMGQDAYIIGGGPSLQGFDWGLLRGKNTIGCNSAFILGSEIVKINIFGDHDWWLKIGRDKGAMYGGLMVACCPARHLKDDKTSWLLTMSRHGEASGESGGLGTTGLGFNGNTGSLAINLALILGARRVFLLGFDMKPKFENGSRDFKPNWHDLRHETGNIDCYARFIKAFHAVWRDLPFKFPGCEIVNVTDDSNLPYFPKLALKEHFNPQVMKESNK